jgi:hypothetical protein
MYIYPIHLLSNQTAQSGKCHHTQEHTFSYTVHATSRPLLQIEVLIHFLTRPLLLSLHLSQMSPQRRHQLLRLHQRLRLL